MQRKTEFGGGRRREEKRNPGRVPGLMARSALVTILSVTFFLATAEAQVPPPGHCQASLVMGLAKIQHGGEQPGERLVGGMSVRPGDVIVTLKGARVELALAGGTVTRVGENTLFTVESVGENELLASAEPASEAANARVWVRTQTRTRGEEPEVAVRTPVVLTAVRGTIFDLNLTGKEAARVRVYEGATNVVPLAVETPSTGGPARSGSSLAPVPVPGPTEIAGPREVTLEEFTVLVRAMQEVTFTRSTRRTHQEARPFDPEEDRQDEWVQWNLELDGERGPRSGEAGGQTEPEGY